MNFGGRPGAAPAKLASRAPELRERRATLCLLQPGRQQPRTASVRPTPLVAPRGGGAGAAGGPAGRCRPQGGERSGAGGRAGPPPAPAPAPAPARCRRNARSCREGQPGHQQLPVLGGEAAGGWLGGAAEGSAQRPGAGCAGAARQHECAVTGGTAGEAAWYTRERPDSRGTCCLRHHLHGCAARQGNEDKVLCQGPHVFWWNSQPVKLAKVPNVWTLISTSYRGESKGPQWAGRFCSSSAKQGPGLCAYDEIQSEKQHLFDQCQRLSKFDYMLMFFKLLLLAIVLDGLFGGN